MAIQTNKFLPAASSLSIVKKSISIPKGGLLKTSSKESEESSDLTIIKNKVIEIDKILKNNFLLTKESIKLKKKESEKEEFESREKKLEEKPKDELKKPSLNLKIPGVGIFESIKRFLFFTALGRLFELTKQFGPQIGNFIKNIAPVIDFIETLVVNVFKAAVDFIDFGYKAYDTVRNFTKQLGGESFQKTFDEFSKNLNTFINLAIIAGMASTGGTDFGGRRGGGRGGGHIGIRGRTPGRSRYGTSSAAARRYAERFGIDAAKKKFGQESVESLGGKYARSGLTNLARKGAVGILGKGGVKAAIKIIKPLTKAIPVIGGLIEFGLALMEGDKPGRAAFRAIGSVLFGAIGAALGGPFALFTGGVGASLGGEAAGKLYDYMFSGKKSTDNKKTQKKATGGSVSTRGGKKVGGPATRKIKVTKIKKQQIKLQKAKPGKDVGGEKKIKKLFPDPMKPIIPGMKPDPKAVNPLETLRKISSTLKQIPFLGGIMGSSIDIAMGQRPEKSLFMGFGDAIGNLIQSAIDNRVGQSINEIVKSTLAMASGGEVVSRSIGVADQTGKEVGIRVAKLLDSSVDSRIDSVFGDIIKQFEKKPLGVGDTSTLDPTEDVEDDGGGGGSLTKGQWGPLLDLIAGKESGGNYEAMYPSTRLPGATKMTIAEVVRRATGAVGKYQQLPQYLYNRAKAAGLNPEKDFYSPENQEKIIINVNIKGRGGQKWLDNKISDEEFMQGLSQEFASLPNAQGKFYYPGQRSSMTAAKVKAALSKVKKGGYSQEEIAKSEEKGGKIISDAGEDGSGAPGALGGTGNFIQGNSGNSRGIHFHIGPGSQQKGTILQKQYFADARATAKQVVKHFMGKKTLYDGRRGTSYKSATDAEIKAAQDAHTHGPNKGSPGGIDIQVGGAYYPGAKVPFPLQIEGMKFRNDGFGVSADISGSNSFVAHGYKDEKGKVAAQTGGLGNLYAQGGGLISQNQTKKDMSSLKTKASYESTGQTIYVKTVIVEKQIPIPIGGGLSGMSIPAGA